ncbi:MAG TPA: transglycosylase SLT domain-containing protein [Myxococcota bacterium]|nr:transglycosylase SLT domain-containing protein [Myxococcota bacterium]HND29187.1 transglycosylase SLT domain-containing protein [Myxococcota bacterium]
MHRKRVEQVSGLGVAGAVLLAFLTLITLFSTLRAEARSFARVEVPAAPVVVRVAMERPKSELDAVLLRRVQARWSYLRTHYGRKGHPCARHRSLFEEAAALSGLPAALIAGVAAQESGRCGDVPGGWMQITRVDPEPLHEAARLLGLRWADFEPRRLPRHAVVGGALVLRDLEARYPERYQAILAYNLGVRGLAEHSRAGSHYAHLRTTLPARVRDYLPAVLAGSLWMEAAWAGPMPAELPEDRLRALLERR